MNERLAVFFCKLFIKEYIDIVKRNKLNLHERNGRTLDCKTSNRKKSLFIIFDCTDRLNKGFKFQRPKKKAFQSDVYFRLVNSTC